MKVFELTPNEYEIMKTLWREDRALSRSEIIDLTQDKSWKSSSIHILLNQLLNKEAIEIEGFVRTGKTYGRSYMATISQDDFDLMQLKLKIDRLNPSEETFRALIKYLLDENKISREVLMEL